MLGENIKALRKQEGMTQEELAARLHVVRQTVSKWEKGLSVPDAEVLQRMAEVLEVPVGELLGAEPAVGPDRNELAEQLARINEQLVIRNRRWRFWLAVTVVFAVLLLGSALSAVLFSLLPGSSTTTTVSMSAADPVYTETEVETAFDVVRRYFDRNFRGCTLLSLSYDEDWSAARSGDWAARYGADKAIVLLSSFTTDDRGGDGSLDPNSTYKDWQWILTRDAGGPWLLRDWGY